MRIRFPRIAIRDCCLLFVALACLSTGCAQLNLAKSNVAKSMPFFSEDEDAPRLPSRIVAVWVDTIRYTQGEKPTRGFGGRIMFYDNEVEEPVKVEGDVVVYAFDEEGRKPTDPRPTRKYVFRADQLDVHYSKSKVGHSYSFFVPWDNVGGFREEISLIVRFQPQLGPAIASEQTRHILPGKPRPEDMQLAEPTDRGQGTVRPASFQSEAQEKPQMRASRGRMHTTTIELPSRPGQQTPQAMTRPRSTRFRPQVPASTSAAQGPQQNQQPTEPLAHSSRSGSRPRAVPAFRREGDRALSQPRLAEWRYHGQSSLPGANDSESN